MKALSIRQPWAHYILEEGKDIENRTWSTEERGDILIHVSKTVEKKDRSLVQRNNLPTGGIVGIVRITDCVEASDSEWFQGPFGLKLAAPRKLPFMPCKGRLGFFHPEISSQVMTLFQRKELDKTTACRILSLQESQFNKFALGQGIPV